jgi:hypothetical protein
MSLGLHFFPKDEETCLPLPTQKKIKNKSFVDFAMF